MIARSQNFFVGYEQIIKGCDWKHTLVLATSLYFYGILAQAVQTKHFVREHVEMHSELTFLWICRLMSWYEYSTGTRLLDWDRESLEKTEQAPESRGVEISLAWWGSRIRFPSSADASIHALSYLPLTLSVFLSSSNHSPLGNMCIYDLNCTSQLIINVLGTHEFSDRPPI